MQQNKMLALRVLGNYAATKNELEELLLTGAGPHNAMVQHLARQLTKQSRAVAIALPIIEGDI